MFTSESLPLACDGFQRTRVSMHLNLVVDEFRPASSFLLLNLHSTDSSDASLLRNLSSTAAFLPLGLLLLTFVTDSMKTRLSSESRSRRGSQVDDLPSGAFLLSNFCESWLEY